MEKEWIAAYAYLAYLFLATLPELTNTPGFNLGIPMFVLIILYLYHSYTRLGKRFLWLLFTSFTLGFIFEFLGVHTGFPFGRYYYTAGLGYQLLGVPIIIPFLWSTLSYFSYLPTGSLFVFPWFMVVIDLTVDPLFSRFDWHWLSPGQYFGLPITNFVSWYLISLLIYLNWRGGVSITYDTKALVFIYGLVLDLALQDYFAGLVYPAIISFLVSTLSFTSIYMLMCGFKPSKPNGVHKDI
ncbi:hypothetical protein B9Q04_02910 [Candidatus Marsarchaeota G2 archaeon BE_D]|jgi:Predicted membrane protein|uniref:Carotenoid biosynthesis protein n=1 Tax=Candidatus Marsarchaeota G2 archaeon BE_D TaxID=1978158 RepID=A0A2R6CDS5_9ARCH|nr:MAG: hypothetical protein B9Q04_02910 [Candidatus Marsarchaeota G2 archaeon BE_D]